MKYVTRAASTAALTLFLGCTGDEVPPESGIGNISRTAEAGDVGDSSINGVSSLADRVIAELTQPYHVCPERVWPNGLAESYRSKQIFLTSPATNTGWLFNDQSVQGGASPAVTTHALDGLSAAWASSFNVGEVAGARTLGVALDEFAASEVVPPADKIERATGLVFHEAFHFLGTQREWNIGHGGRRADSYPVRWEPRYYRAQLIAALRANLEQGVELGRAAFWRQRMATEFAQELESIRSTDIREGSAEYAEHVSGAIAKLGCGAGEPDLVANVVSDMSSSLYESFTLDHESYQIGLLAGLTLRKNQVQGWETRLESGVPADAQLLENVTSVPQPDDIELQQRAQASVEARNAELAADIEPMLKELSSPEAHRIVIDSDWMLGSFAVSGFYYLPEQPGQPEVYHDYSALLETPSGTNIEVQEETILDGFNTPCSISPIRSKVLTLAAADVTVTGDLATSTAATVAFKNLKVRRVLDEQGLPWLCAEGEESQPEDGTEPPAPRNVPERAAVLRHR